MKIIVLFTSMAVTLVSGCKESTTGPTSTANLLTNPRFEQNGKASLTGWTVVDSSGVQLSNDVPPGGSGKSIVVYPSWLPTWPIGIIYQAIPASPGTHVYRLSVFGKKAGISGGVAVRLNRNDNYPASGWFPGIAISDSVWTSYSQVDTVTASPGDSLFFAVLTGACELCQGLTYLNSCSLEKLQ